MNTHSILYHNISFKTGGDWDYNRSTLHVLRCTINSRLALSAAAAAAPLPDDVVELVAVRHHPGDVAEQLKPGVLGGLAPGAVGLQAGTDLKEDKQDIQKVNPLADLVQLP